ncbi:MAG: MMPL family transporter [Campylobacterales bacterium]|nr:MMPL family transporter [Campylobacterales bacterium]
MFQFVYEKIIFPYAKIVMGVLFVFTLVMGYFATKLEIDASAQTLLLEGDKDLEFTRKIGQRFTAPDFLVVTYTAQNDLLSQSNIDNIVFLQKEFLKIESIESVTDITNVPLLQSPARPIKSLVEHVPTLMDKNIDKSLVTNEFLTSALYKQNLVSDDLKTCAILLNLKKDKRYFELINEENKFIQLKQNSKLTQDQKIEYQKLKLQLKEHRDKLREINHENIIKIRSIINNFEANNTSVNLHLGGANMISDDMVEFVKNDLNRFGILIVILLVVILFILFKELRWVALPLFICTVSIVISSGFLGLFGWEITVISSNFISLQLIMNISLVVHLIIKYKELNQVEHDLTQKEILFHTVDSMAKPSFFVVITTIAGFSSLVFSSILPVMNFGWMMSLGIVVSLLMTFILFPLSLVFFPLSQKEIDQKANTPLSVSVGRIALRYPKFILFVASIIVIYSITGATKLRVENSFIDYFKSDTQIHQGMKLIDQKLGGTTPLDVVITFKENSDEIAKIKVIEQNDEMLDEFSQEFASDENDKITYWFTKAKMDRISMVHDYLDSLEPIGKVLSLATIEKIGKILNDGKSLDTLTLSLLYKELPQKYKKVILTPYVDVQNNMARISTRIIDSMPNLKRDELLKKINKDLQAMINPKYEEFKVSNLMVIYNNMLQSLFDSQIKTISVVVLILFIMFLVLFRSFQVAIMAIIANIVPVGVIFGFMGWFDIPLDMMTITIAAISIGIAVDDTIHYIHRFKIEYTKTNSYEQSLKNSHRSIGRAMFYTSTIIMVGFSLLVISNFIPTIYFGLLTMIAMFMAIIADLLLLPVLLRFYKS